MLSAPYLLCTVIHSSTYYIQRYVARLFYIRTSKYERKNERTPCGSVPETLRHTKKTPENFNVIFKSRAAGCNSDIGPSWVLRLVFSQRCFGTIYWFSLRV